MKTSTSKNFLWDVFLSYSHPDKPRVRLLAEKLRKAKLRVWFDEWIITSGKDSYAAVEGLERSRTLILCMSNAAFGSDWVQLERGTAMFRDPQNKHRRFIPLLLEDCPIPDTVRRYTYIDWRSSEITQFKRLVASCREPRERKRRDVSREAELWGHNGWISAIDVTSDNRRALTASWDTTLGLWDLKEGDNLIRQFRGHTDRVNDCAINSTYKWAVSVANDKTLRIWDVTNGECRNTFRYKGGIAQSVAMLHDGQRFLTGGTDGKVRLWDKDTGAIRSCYSHEMRVNSVAVACDDQFVVSGSADGTIWVWDLLIGEHIGELKGHEGQVFCVAISPDSNFILSGGLDSTARLWDTSSLRCLGVFEGHARRVESVGFASNNHLAVSSGEDGARIWRIPSGECLMQIRHAFGIAAFTPDAKRLITGLTNGRLALWPLSVIPKSSLESTRYTNAKVVLLGESGVGKTGLANRLIGNHYESTDSTHGMRVERLVLPQTTKASMEREVWLWDLAGQDDYRLIHQLFLDETAVALMVINPQADDPFERVGDWLKALRTALRDADHKPARLLIAARVDRGGMKVSEDKIKRFLEDNKFDGWLPTSAKTGKNCSDQKNTGKASALKEFISRYIPWDHLPFISTDRLLRELKDAVLEKATRYDAAIIRFTELMQQVVSAFPGDLIDPTDVRKAVRLLGNQGVIKPLDFGGLVLLRPSLLNDYAAAVIRAARKHTDEIGCVLEKEVLDAEFDLSGVERIEEADERLLLRAMVQTFLNRSLCLAEETTDGRQLIFPSQFRRDRPITAFPETIVTYTFGGELPTIFTTLVVRLWYSRAFDNKEIWQNAAEFLTKGNSTRIGFVMEKVEEGTGKISIFSDTSVSDDQKVVFIEFVHQHLAKNAIELVRERRYICINSKCGRSVNDLRAVKVRLDAGMTFITCSYCDKKVPLIDVIEKRATSDLIARKVREMDEMATTQLDNQAREQILIGHMMAICGEANQIFRPTTMFDYGIDGEVEFKGNDGQPSGKKVYVQLKSGNSFLRQRKGDGKLIFDVQNERHIQYWQKQPCHVYLVIRNHENDIQWMDLTSYLKQRIDKGSRQIEFMGRRLDAFALMHMRDKLIPTRAS